MNLIYLHGFQSSPLSLKGQQLKRYSQTNRQINVHLPDLNRSPYDVMAQLTLLIERLDHVVLVGSSFGGFYATQIVAKYATPAALINPTVQPWALFKRLFKHEALPYRVNETWLLTEQDLEDLQQIELEYTSYKNHHVDLNNRNVLVLLQQGDEVLDYSEAQGYYTQPLHRSLVMTETRGNHAMYDFEEKIPLIIEFLSSSIDRFSY